MILPRRKAFATFLVLWAIALAAIILASLQSVSHRQAAAGRMAVARVRAYWAARGAIEAQIAVLTSNTLSPDTGSALTITEDLAVAGRGELKGATFLVEHAEYPNFRDGAMDAHSKLNINTMSKDSMLLLPDMDEATADAITDWIDDDDEPEEFGAEEGQYTSQKYPYKPRNAPLRSLRELELIIGVNPEYVRGEDWNLNGLLDPNEDDGNLSWPNDNADGKLDAGWSQYLTAISDSGVGPGYGPSGEPRLDLATATSEDVAKRLKVDTAQADAIVDHVANGGTLSDFLESELSTLATGATTQLNGQRPAVSDLTTDQLAALLDETHIPDDNPGPRSGKLNINTVDQDSLQYLAELTSGVADAIITERNARSGGFTSLTDLLEVPSVSRELLAQLYPYIDVRSQVYIATARGRDEASGLEVEIQAVLDRSTIPVVIRDLTFR
jgi:DNA uptake protein ComE-like DNA-binding protein